MCERFKGAHSKRTTAIVPEGRAAVDCAQGTNVRQAVQYERRNTQQDDDSAKGQGSCGLRAGSLIDTECEHEEGLHSRMTMTMVPKGSPGTCTGHMLETELVI